MSNYDYEDNRDESEEEYIERQNIMNDMDTNTDSESFISYSSSSGDGMIYVDEYVDEDRVSEIYDIECDFIDEPRSHGKYYIGYYWFDYHLDILLDTIVQPRTFFKYKYDEIISYLAEMSIFVLPYRRKSKMQIMQLTIKEDGTYTVVLKTHWLRLIQRRWRNIYNERKRILLNKKKLSAMRHSELTGKSCYFPGLSDMFYTRVII